MRKPRDNVQPTKTAKAANRKKFAGKLPVTIITGYLGAGKTTLLRRLLQFAQQRKLKLAVLMNEFGEVGIDGEVIKGANVNVIELSGGCVCCSLTGEFEAAMKEIAEKIKPQHVVVETTGVAEPDAIALDVEENLPFARLDAVVTIADADSLARFPTLGQTGRVQLEIADLILLNKTDLVKQNQLSEIEAGLGKLNPRAKIVKTKFCEVDAGMVLGIQTRGKVFALQAGHEEPKNEFFVFRSEKKFDLNKLQAAIAKLSHKIYRAKGFVNVEDQGTAKTLLFNYVAGRSNFEQWPQPQPTRMVFIGDCALKAKKKVLGLLRKAIVRPTKRKAY